MNKIIIAFVAVVAVILGGYYVYKMQKPAYAPEQEQQLAPVVSEEQPKSYTVTYSTAGFSPTPLTISLGDTVNFRNDDTSPVWVASAPHPAHTDYPEFDAKRGYAQGETYSFTFTKVGTWKYHNHLNVTSGHYGSVVVVE